MRYVAAFLIAATAWATIPPPLDVWNAASREVGIAPGSLIKLGTYALPGQHNISVMMQSQGSTQAVACQVLSGAPFPFYWAVVPETMLPGPTTVTAIVDGGFFASSRITLVSVAPAVFVVAPEGVGPALAQNIESGTAPSLNQLTNPALPGGFVTLWGTGLGTARAADVTVDVAGTSVSPSFAGRAPGLPGVDQINFQLPLNSYTGCYVPVTLRTGTVMSIPVTLAINPTPGACAHLLGLSYSDLQTLDGGGQIPVGSVRLAQGQPALQQQPVWVLGLSIGGPSALFSMLDAGKVFLLSQPQAPPAFGCTVPLFSIGIDAVALPYFDAGAQMTLSGPGGVNLAMRPQGGFYAAGATALVPGAWQISAPGGRDIGALQQAFTLPTLPILTSASRTSSNGDVVIQWNPQGYSAGDVMTVSLGTGNVTDSASAICTAPATAGQAVIPGDLMSSAIAPAPNAALLTVSQFPAARLLFSAPFLATGGTIPVVIGYSLSQVQPITLP